MTKNQKIEMVKEWQNGDMGFVPLFIHGSLSVVSAAVYKSPELVRKLSVELGISEQLVRNLAEAWVAHNEDGVSTDDILR